MLPPLSNGLLWNTAALATNGTLTVGPVAPPAINAFALLTNGGFQLNFSGTPGQAYEVRAGTNLALSPICKLDADQFRHVRRFARSV